MNHIHILRIGIILALCWTPATASSQDEMKVRKVPLPKGILLRKMKAAEAWAIQFSYAEAEKNSTQTRSTGKPVEEEENVRDKPKLAKFIKSDPNWHMRLDGSTTGRQIEYWSDGVEFFIKRSDDARAKRRVLDYDEDEPDEDGSYLQDVIAFALMEKRFPGFSWISAKNFKGLADVNGVECLVFQDGETIAWIHERKREPVLWKKGIETRLFTALPTPGRITFPKHVADILEGLRQDNLRYTHKPPPGG